MRPRGLVQVVVTSVVLGAAVGMIAAIFCKESELPPISDAPFEDRRNAQGKFILVASVRV